MKTYCVCVTGSRAVHVRKSMEGFGNSSEETLGTTGNENSWPRVRLLFLLEDLKHLFHCIATGFMLIFRLSYGSRHKNCFFFLSDSVGYGVWQCLCFHSDMVYCGVYNNALDSDNYNLAKGFNYHQGPVSKRTFYCSVCTHTLKSSLQELNWKVSINSQKETKLPCFFQFILQNLIYK